MKYYEGKNTITEPDGVRIEITKESNSGKHTSIGVSSRYDEDTGRSVMILSNTGADPYFDKKQWKEINASRYSTLKSRIEREIRTIKL